MKKELRAVVWGVGGGGGGGKGNRMVMTWTGTNDKKKSGFRERRVQKMVGDLGRAYEKIKK